MVSCVTHSDLPVAGTCRTCGLGFCDDCLVYAFGEGRNPYCVECALTATTNGGGTKGVDTKRATANGASSG